MHQILSPSLDSLRLTFSTCCEKYYDANSTHPKSSTSNPNDSVLSAWCCAYAYACTQHIIPKHKTHSLTIQLPNSRRMCMFVRLILHPKIRLIYTIGFFFYAAVFIRLAELKTRIMCMRFVYMFASFKQATPKANE